MYEIVFLKAITFNELLQGCTEFIITLTKETYNFLSDNLLFSVPIALIIMLAIILGIFKVI